MARLVTGWHVDTKVLGVGLAGMGLHAWSISYCDHALSDGFVPHGAWPSLPGVAVAVKRLVTAGLWLPTEGGFWLHNYKRYNRTKAQVDAYMAAKIAAGRAGGLSAVKTGALANARAVAQANAKARVKASAQENGDEDLSKTLSKASKQNLSPGPGPGDVVTSAGLSAGPVPRAPTRGRARETASQQPSNFQVLNDEVPDEVRFRLAQPPIGHYPP